MKKYILLVLTILCFWELSNAQNINKIEYFIDSDPGFGVGVDVPITANTPVIANFTVALPNTVSDGFHYLSVRARDVNNNWGMTTVRPFYKEAMPANSTPPNITLMEYFVNADPGYGAGINVPLTAGMAVSKNFMASLGSLTNGNHKLIIRAKDINNCWN